MASTVLSKKKNETFYHTTDALKFYGGTEVGDPLESALLEMEDSV
jgi:hypothetical protein